MKKALAFLAVGALLALLPLGLLAERTVPVWTAQATNVETAVDTTGAASAVVSIWAASGTPDGTVRIIYLPLGSPTYVTLATYAMPTSVKSFRGPVGEGLRLVLTGNTTGTVGAVAVLK